MAVAYWWLVFLCLLFWGEPPWLAQEGRILPAPSGFTYLSGSEPGVAQCQPLCLGFSGSLCWGVEVEFWGYALPDLLFVAPCLLFVWLGNGIGWVRSLW